MYGIELPEGMEWAAEELVELIIAGLSPAEAVDYWATEGRNYTQAEWAEIRSTSRQNVNKNVAKAEEKLEANDPTKNRDW